MTVDDVEQFGVELAKLFAGSGWAKPGQTEFDAYWETLEDLEWWRVQAGFRSARRVAAERRPTEGAVRGAALAAKNPEALERERLALESVHLGPAVAWTPEQQEEARDMISRLKRGPLADMLERVSGLPESEGR
jgi:hypothetical protein